MPVVKSTFNKEYEYVVKPLVKYLKASNSDWKIYIPKYHTSATGWDIEARRSNQDLLIEAKFMGGPFLSKINSLVTAPLANRRRKLPKSSRPYAVCWALGAKNMRRNPFQLLWDFFERQPTFWNHYQKDLKVKYIFLVNGGRVARLDFAKFLSYTSRYRKRTKNKRLAKRRVIATDIIKNHFNKVYGDFYDQ